MTDKKIPTVHVSMPCYDTMQVPTCLSLLKLFDKFTAAKIKTNISTFKSPYVGYSRNILAALFLESNYDYQLFVDADVSFEPEVIGSMIMAQKDFICAPYRKKTHDNSVSYSVAFPDYKNIKIDKTGITEIIGGPAGLTLIHRSVYEKLIKDYSKLKINYSSGISDEAKKYLYNFWENTFDSKEGAWYGEDVSFCSLARQAGFKLHALVHCEVGHHGTFNFSGKFVDTFSPSDEKSN